MNQLLSIFLPAVLAVYVSQKIEKKEISNREIIFKYLIFTLIINIMSYIVSIYFFGKPEFIFTNVFTVKYLCLSSTIGIFVSFVIGFIEKNLEISIRIDKNEK